MVHKACRPYIGHGRRQFSVQLTVGQEVVGLFLIQRLKSKANALRGLKKDIGTYLFPQKWEPIKTDTYGKL